MTDELRAKVENVKRMLEYGEKNGKKNMIVDLDVLRVLVGDGNQTLTIDELTVNFYTLKMRYSKLAAYYKRATTRLEQACEYLPKTERLAVCDFIARAQADIAGEVSDT